MIKPRLAVDFDDTIFDGREILPGCREGLAKLRERFFIAIFSARSTPQEIAQMVEILLAEKVPFDEILPPKPIAYAYLDDRGIHFESWSDAISRLTVGDV